MLPSEATNQEDHQNHRNLAKSLRIIRILEKSKDFEEVGGFDETMSGPEDWDIDKKLKNIGPIGLLPLITEFPKATTWKLAHLIKCLL